MSIVSNAVFSPDVINVGGEFMTVFLIIALVTSLFLVDTKYWNKRVSGVFDISSNPMLAVFVTIVIFKVIIIII